MFFLTMACLAQTRSCGAQHVLPLTEIHFGFVWKERESFLRRIMSMIC